MTDEDVLKVLNSIDWDEYNITPFEGTDEEFNKYPLIYDGRSI